ncbi:uncharacterized protein [Drosophila kikkawai]|uniref:Uncharacterized protein n=1 Tax=Drosophila kikkawai TaxID=30033 RepID=A0A6P4IYT3_DROKI|nr:uncharacterized protein LOC108078255 [Drosophila kikkawai]
MIKKRYILITLVLGLCILPLIFGESKAPDLPGNSTLMNAVWPKDHLNGREASKLRTKRLKKIIARKKFAKQLIRMTNPWVDTFDHIPKMLRDLEGTNQKTNKLSSNSTFKHKNDTPIPYAKLLRLFIEYAWNNPWQSINKN